MDNVLDSTTCHLGLVSQVRYGNELKETFVFKDKFLNAVYEGFNYKGKIYHLDINFPDNDEMEIFENYASQTKDMMRGFGATAWIEGKVCRDYLRALSHYMGIPLLLGEKYPMGWNDIKGKGNTYISVCAVFCNGELVEEINHRIRLLPITSTMFMNLPESEMQERSEVNQNRIQYTITKLYEHLDRFHDEWLTKIKLQVLKGKVSKIVSEGEIK